MVSRNEDGIIDWIGSWMTDRGQRIVVDGEVSNWKSVLSGIPQGSVLGPYMGPMYSVLVYSSTLLKYSYSWKLWVMYSYSCSMYSDFMSTFENFYKHDGVLII